MPFYDYRCVDCGDFEDFQKISDPDWAKCPNCGKKSEKLLSASSIKGDPTTIGALADKNTNKMGKYELEDRRIKEGHIAKQNKKTEYDRVRKLANMTPKEKRDYIVEGKLK